MIQKDTQALSSARLTGAEMSRAYDETVLKQVLLRIPQKTHRELEAAAKKNKRSLTAEVLERVEQSLRDDKPGSIEERLAALEAEMKDLKAAVFPELPDLEGNFSATVESVKRMHDGLKKRK